LQVENKKKQLQKEADKARSKRDFDQEIKDLEKKGKEFMDLINKVK